MTSREQPAVELGDPAGNVVGVNRSGKEPRCIGRRRRGLFGMCLGLSKAEVFFVVLRNGSRLKCAMSISVRDKTASCLPKAFARYVNTPVSRSRYHLPHLKRLRSDTAWRIILPFRKTFPFPSLPGSREGRELVYLPGVAAVFPVRA